MRIVTAIIAAFVFSSTAIAQNDPPLQPSSPDQGWALISESDSFLLYIQKGSLRADGPSRWRIWTKTMTKGQAPSWFGYTVDLELINCEREEMALRASTVHRPDGSVYSTRTFSEAEMKWNPIAPNSMVTNLLVAVCNTPRK